MVVEASGVPGGSRRRMEQRHEWFPARLQDRRQRGRGDHGGPAARPGRRRFVTGRRPAEQSSPLTREGARSHRTNAPSGQRLEPARVPPLSARAGLDPLSMEPRIDGVRPGVVPGVKPRAKLSQASGSRRGGRGRTLLDGRPRRPSASSRKNSSVKRPGCSSDVRFQPRNSSRQAIQRRPAYRRLIVPRSSCRHRRFP